MSTLHSLQEPIEVIADLSVLLHDKTGTLFGRDDCFGYCCGGDVIVLCVRSKWLQAATASFHLPALLAGHRLNMAGLAGWQAGWLAG